MGGFEVTSKTYELTWDKDTAYAGLEVSAKGVSTEVFLEVTALTDTPDGNLDIKEMARVLRLFGESLAAWNVTEGGKPVPADYEHLAALDVDLTLEMFGRWAQAIGGVDPTSPPESSNGATSGPVPPGLAAASVSLGS